MFGVCSLLKATSRPSLGCPGLLGRPVSLRHLRVRLSYQRTRLFASGGTLGRKCLATTMQTGGQFHDAAGKRFGVAMDGAEAYVTYELDETAKTLDLQHTWTPPELRGKGLAGQVVTIAYEYAKENDLKVIPTCTYIPVFVKKNPEWAPYTTM